MFTTAQEAHIRDIKCALYSSIAQAKSQPWGQTVDWDNAYVSGGAIASLLQGSKPSDIDIYFRTQTSMTRSRSGVMSFPDHIKDVDENYRDVIGLNGKMVTERSVTMTTGHSIISMHYGDPKDVRDTFDYVHCTPYYDIHSNNLWISPHQYFMCCHKILSVNNPKTFTNKRQAKFLNRGYTLDLSCDQWNNTHGVTITYPTPTS